ncbi:VOC family protein [Pseudohalioglobus lutimaris]|uniref:VOC domain-containing protein n=1 Tax=Pseudohalioglobus lutimaris TaxID=1737061 RepID=A0A2N5WZ30_9GAMM|nr:VOC family protein [Pseudohalioglobus lutimaris]PLW67497.1 hypothetical protein C0039_16440 [Pseudohalioglobus lutimaris]
MITAFDRIVIEVPDLGTARAEYQQLLGKLDDQERLHLGNIEIQLRESSSGASAHITALTLLDTTLEKNTEQHVDSGSRGISLARSHFREPDCSGNPVANGIYAVDHLVLQSNDADDCIRLFAADLGIRLALDQEVPEWGGRMLFFRMGKMTLEVIHNSKRPPERDFFWGITYLCQDIDNTLASFDQRGIAHSPARIGRKPGTRVATIQSHCLGLPTLLVAPA